MPLSFLLIDLLSEKSASFYVLCLIFKLCRSHTHTYIYIYSILACFELITFKSLLNLFFYCDTIVTSPLIFLLFLGILEVFSCANHFLHIWIFLTE